MCEGEGSISSSLRTTRNRARSSELPGSPPLANPITFDVTYSNSCYYLYVGGNDYPMFIYFIWSKTIWADTIHTSQIQNWFLDFLCVSKNCQIYVTHLNHPWARNYVKKIFD